MGEYPRSCEEVKQDLQKRHQPFVENGWTPLNLDNDVSLHRLIRQEDIDFNTSRPKSSTFTNYGLSVYVESPNYPPFDIRQQVASNEIFVGAVVLKASLVKELEFEICHDPHPYPQGNPQHPNHAQIVCKKTQSKVKAMRDKCEWSVRPDCL